MKNMKNIFLIQMSILFMLAGCSKISEKEVERLVYVNYSSLTMSIGEEEQLTASPTSATFTWESADTSVATVSPTGLVRAAGEGETNIIVRSGDATGKVLIIVIP